MKKNSIYLLSFTLSALLVVWLFSYWAVLDNAADTRALSFLTPLINCLSSLGKLYVDNAQDLVPWCAGIFAAGSLMLLVRCGYFLFGAAVAFAVAGQALFLFQHIPIGLAAYTSAVVFAAIHFIKNPLDTFSDNRGSRANTARDMLVLFCIIVVASVYRFYAINHLFNTFEGELSPYSAGATSLQGIPMANKGVGGPWAPLGILYYLPIYLTTSLFGTTLTSLRISSAIVGVLTVPLIYFLMRRVSNSLTALLAAFLFALNSLHIGWSRTDVHPHGVTTWPSLLLCWMTLAALTTQKRIYFFLMAIVMGLTWHQYPSGQSAVAIPIITVILYWIFNGFKLPFRARALTWILLGVALWVISLPFSYYLADGEFVFLNPFTLTTERASWGRASGEMGIFGAVLFVLQTACAHFMDVLQAIFIKAPYLFHQDFVPEVHPFSVRTVPWLLVPFAVLGLIIVVKQCRRVESLVIIAWLVAGVLPGILSEHAYPKRLSTVFPALDCLSALSIGSLITIARHSISKYERAGLYAIIAAIFIAFSGFTSAVWFASTKWPYGEPPEIRVYKSIAKLIEPETIILTDMWKDYDEGKAIYLLLDNLTSKEKRPNLVFLTRPDVQGIDLFIPNPLNAPKLLEERAHAWWYDWTKLGQQKAESLENQKWRYVLYLLQERTNSESSNSNDIAWIQERCNDPIIARFPETGSFTNPMTVIRCTLQ